MKNRKRCTRTVCNDAVSRMGVALVCDRVETGSGSERLFPFDTGRCTPYQRFQSIEM